MTPDEIARLINEAEGMHDVDEFGRNDHRCLMYDMHCDGCGFCAQFWKWTGTCKNNDEHIACPRCNRCYEDRFEETCNAPMTEDRWPESAIGWWPNPPLGVELYLKEIQIIFNFNSDPDEDEDENYEAIYIGTKDGQPFSFSLDIKGRPFRLQGITDKLAMTLNDFISYNALSRRANDVARVMNGDISIDEIDVDTLKPPTTMHDEDEFGGYRVIDKIDKEITL